MWMPNRTGVFRENTYKKEFTFQPTQNPWAIQHGLTHEIDVLDGVRYARVLKTRAYVCVDESADGTPVCELWHISNHRCF
jgi:hypothetical protein